MVSATPNFKRAAWRFRRDESIPWGKKSKSDPNPINLAFQGTIQDRIRAGSGRNFGSRGPLLNNLIEILLEDKIGHPAFDFFLSAGIFYENSRR
jgi:hypothetical protein